ncbi:MAG: ABC transporter substrate-binding protein [Acidimicrobiia bacterium]|nr:ABC transporter substrate-binding protein [Acidimicrobiia bacterium]MYL10543.1 ABC transporter substrate-binding protein [Acidimicrobiia bacterium]
MSHKMLKILGALLALVLIAAACGGDDDDDGGAQPAPSEQTAAPAPDEPDAPADTGDGDEPAPAEEETTAPAPEEPEAPADTGDGDEPAPEEPVEIGFDEPRGEMFIEFHRTFDRTHPFQPLDMYCTATPDPDSPPQATDPGITEESITIVHLRTKLEELEGIGFAVPVGDPANMFETFTKVINEQCNGIWGRQIDLRLVEVSALGGGGEDIDTLRNQACIEATEDHNAVIVTNSTGFQGTAILCITDHDTLFLTTQGNPADFHEQANGLLYSMSPVAEHSVVNMTQAVIDTGALDGKTIAVIWPDTPGQPETVQAGIIDVLEAAGYEIAVAEQIGCGGATQCTLGNDIAVEQMLEEGVDVVFPGLNVLSLPQFINEMISQGFRPGDVQFYNSDLNSQAGDLVSGKVAQFGGDAAAELYNGTIIIDDAPTGNFRVADPVLSFNAPLNIMCNETYADNNDIGAAHIRDVYGSYDSAYGMTTGVCAEMRMVARAIYDAGPNPTREDIFNAFRNLGSVDIQHQLPATFGPDKFGAPDVVTELVFQFPCPNDPDIPTCIEQTAPYRPIGE